jgi:hypothetical protein
VVITEAGNDPKVAGLVYIAAFAPDNGGELRLVQEQETVLGRKNRRHRRIVAIRSLRCAPSLTACWIETSPRASEGRNPS